MRINILDPGLQQAGGHHPVWDRRLAEELVLLGHDVCTYANTTLELCVREQFLDVGDAVPHFSVNPYTHPQAIDPLSGELSLFIDGAAILARELKALRNADAWLWPTLFPHHVYATALSADVPRNAGCIHQQVEFQANQGAAVWRYAHQCLRRRQAPFAIGVTGPRLQEEYDRLLGPHTVRVLPSCHDGAPFLLPKQALRRVGFFGFQRAEKGISLLEPLVERIIASGLDVLLHDSSGTLAIAPRPGLDLVGYTKDLRQPIGGCDLVIVLQQAENYRVRESGVVMDGIACGVPVMVARGTASEARVKAEGCGGVYYSLTVGSVMHTLELCRDHYHEMAAAAHDSARRWAEAHGARHFALSMLSMIGGGGRLGD